MKISPNFQGFIFGYLLPEARRAPKLKLHEILHPFRPAPISKESLRSLFKYWDFNYPRDCNNQPLSYRVIDSKQMTEHVNWIVRMAAQSGYEMQHVKEEWDRLLNEAGISK